MLNILVASDHKLYREALTCLLSVQPLVGEVNICADTHAAIAIAAHENPDIVLLDGSSDPLAAIEATKKINACSTASIIAISQQADEGFANHMMAAGALGYLTKQCLSAEIIIAIKEVAKDNYYSCLDKSQFTIPTPAAISASSYFKKSIAFIRSSTRKKVADSSVSHWHAILKFTN